MPPEADNQEHYDRIIQKVKEHCEAQGTVITDKEAHDATRNLIGFVESMMEFQEEQIKIHAPKIVDELTNVKARCEAGDPEILRRVQHSAKVNGVKEKDVVYDLDKYLERSD